jgi:hypothetical protein
MSIIALLHNLLKEKLPGIHATRLTALMAAVEAGLKGASVSITTLGRGLSGPAYIKHKIKRMDRLAGNRHLNIERTAVYGAITQWLLQSLPMPLILIDWSPLTADQNQQVLRAALPTGGRSVTLYEEIHPLKKLGSRRVQQQFLNRLQALLPANVTPIIVVDSGFRTPFFREVDRLGWHWLGRIRNHDFIAWADRPNDWMPAKSLHTKATRKPKCLGLALWVRRNPLDGELVTFYQSAKGRKHFTTRHHPSQSSASRKRAKREKEPWLLVVSPSLKAFSAARIVDYYRSRMQIVEGLRDTKSTHYSLDFTNESRIEAERRANLLLIAALIIFALWLTGLCLKGTDIERHIKVNSSQDHSPYSVIFLARIACRYILFELSVSMLEEAQALLLDYFDSFEGG